MLAAVEAAIVSTLTTVLGTRVKVVESAPGRWGPEHIKRLVRQLPGVYVVWDGGDADDGDELFVTTRWYVYVAVGHDGLDQRARRLGKGAQEGAYALVETVAGALHSTVVPDGDPCGHLFVTRIENLYQGALETKQLALYAVTLSLGAVIEAEPALGELDDFLRAGVGWDGRPGIDWDGAPDGEPDGEPIAIPQGEAA